MPLTPTPYMGLVKPTPGGDVDIWDDELNTAFDVLDGHTHSIGSGNAVSMSSLAAADLDLDNHSIVDASQLGLQNLGAVLSSGANKVFASGGNLYFRNNGGTNVQITSGASINVSLVGGITGDYASVGAEISYEDANDRYLVRQQVGAAVRQYAKIRSADLQLVEYLAAGASPVPANAVTLRSPAALAAAYNVTWPAALPAVTQLVTMTSAGVLAVTAPTSFPHGDFSVTCNAMQFAYDANWSRGVIGQIASTGAGAAFWSPPLLVGDQAKSLQVVLSGNSTADFTIYVYQVDSGGTATDRGNTTVTNPSAIVQTVTLNFTDFTIGTNESVLVRFDVNAASGVLYSAKMVFDHPS